MNERTNAPALVSAADFWQALAAKLQDAMRERSDWKEDYFGGGTWTTFMKDAIRRTVGEFDFGNEEGSFTAEDFRVDFCCFSQGNGAPKDAWSWDLRIAVEHENDGKTWHHEWVKLSHLLCDLRVVISYHSAPRSLTVESEELVRAAKLVEERLRQPSGGEWLLVLGPSYRAVEQGQDFVAFAFDGKGFQPLPDLPIVPDLG